MTENQRFPQIGEVYVMSFSGLGHEQSGSRPGIVFQNNTGNRFSPNIIALPLTTCLKKTGQPTHVLLPAGETGLLRDSMALCENPERMSKEHIGKFVTKLPERYMRQIAAASLAATSAISFLDRETLLSIWELAIRLNAA